MTTPFKFKGIALTLATGMLLQGCAGQITRDAKKDSASTKAEIAVQQEVLQSKPIKNLHPTRSDEAYMPVTLVASVKKIELPAVFSKQMAIHRDFSSLIEVAERITFHSQLLVSITPDAEIKPGMQGMPQAGMAVGAQGAGAMGIPQMPSAMPMPGQISGQMQVPAQTFAHLDFEGTVEGFLNLASSRYGVSWRYANGQIEIYRTITKTLTIRATPGTKDFTNTVVSGDGPKSTSSYNLSIWTGIEQALIKMKSLSGQVYMNQATGTVTITDIPSYLAQMESYIEQQNAILSKQAYMSIRIMSVTAKKSDNKALNLGAVFASLSKNYGLSYASAFATDPSAASLTMRVLNTAGATSPNATIGALQGSNAVVSALESNADVTTLTSWSGSSMNLQQTPISVGRDSAYLQSMATTATVGVGSTTTLTPGTYVTGVSMNVTPHILDAGELSIEYSLNIAALANMFTQTVGGSTVSYPEIDKRKLMDTILMRSGQTLILTGFDQNTADITDQDTGLGVGILAGGAHKVNHNKDTLIILITAITADKI